MPLTPEEPESIEEEFEDARTDILAGIEDIVTAQPVKSLLIAFSVGFLVGKLVGSGPHRAEAT